MLTTPAYSATTQAQRSRAQFMLTAGGRVVRIRHDPSAGNKLMVPTEHELKTILYEQTGERNATEGNRRESIDYVALNAQPRPRKKGSKKKVRKTTTRVVGNANTTTGRRAYASGRSHIRNQETADDMVGSALHHTIASPSGDAESREDEDVSSFLDSFSACGMASKLLASAPEMVTGAQSSPFSLPPRGEAPDGRVREAETVVDDDAQATLAISEPLAQIDLYSILARAPPAELGSAAPQNPGGDGEEGAGPTISKTAIKKLANIEGRGERRTFKTVAGQTPREELGGYLARDPLGEEVAELDAKAQESLRRITKDAKRERLAPTMDIGRHYAALFAEKTKPPKATKQLVDEDGVSGNEDKGTDAAAGDNVANSDDHASYVTQDLGQGSRARRRTAGNRRSRRRRKSGRDKDTKAAGVDNLSRGAENRSSWGNVAMNNCLDESSYPREVQRVDKKRRKEESGRGLPTRGVDVKRVAQGEPRATGETETESDESRGVIVDGGREACGKKRESENERAQPGRVKVEDNGCCAGEEGARQHQEENSQDDCDVECHSSNYGEESFEPADESEEEGCLEVGVDEASSFASRGDADDVVENNVGWQEKSACSGQGATAEITLLEESTAAASASAATAAVRIESCWRGFLGRCAAKIALRSALLTALRNIGGGKISKVLTLADIEREEKKGLNRALRVATLSRQQLPSQAHIAECVRFVETLQRRRARIVEARKRRWVAERRQRQEGECCYGYGGHHVPIPGFAARAKSNPECFTRARRKPAVAASSGWP